MYNKDGMFESLRSSGNEYFLLMNKNRPIYKFRFTGDEEIQVVDIFEKPPFWIKDLYTWLSSRNAAKHRNDIRKFLEDNGALSTKGFTILTRCFSMNDTLWVREENDSTTWEESNPYFNKFRESLGEVMSGDYLCSTSLPTCSTDGEFYKCWVKREGRNVLIKEARSGLEPYAECFASRLKLVYADTVQYDVEKVGISPRTVCDCFTDENCSYIPFILWSDKYLIEDISELYDSVESRRKFFDMLLLDAVCVNIDRHFRNFGVLLNPDDYSVYGMSPIFDMNYAYGSYSLFETGRPIDEYIESKNSRRFGDFIEAISGNINVDSVCSIEESLKELEHTGIPGCEDWFFSRMVEMTKIQLSKVKSLIK